jgi:Suppressor of fused protein (SUFU)
MSERPMRGGRSAELMLLLPPTWPAPGTPEFEDERGYWPYRLLQDLARLPHEYDTLLWSGHTVPNGDPAQPYAKGAGFSGALIAPPVIAPEGFHTLEHDGREITFFAVWPLYDDEMRLKLDQGVAKLAALMDEARLLEVVNVGRPSVVPQRRRGLFRRG